MIPDIFVKCVPSLIFWNIKQHQILNRFLTAFEKQSNILADVKWSLFKVITTVKILASFSLLILLKWTFSKSFFVSILISSYKWVHAHQIKSLYELHSSFWSIKLSKLLANTEFPLRYRCSFFTQMHSSFRLLCSLKHIY